MAVRGTATTNVSFTGSLLAVSLSILNFLSRPFLELFTMNLVTKSHTQAHPRMREICIPLMKGQTFMSNSSLLTPALPTLLTYSSHTSQGATKNHSLGTMRLLPHFCEMHRNNTNINCNTTIHKADTCNTQLNKPQDTIYTTK